MKLRLFALVVLFVTVIHHAPAQEKTTWKAGLASIVITP
jgi:hypothetical protein